MTKVVDDIDDLMDEVKENIRKEPSRFFRIGTWELGDSLALEVKTGQAEKLIREFARLSNAVSLNTDYIVKSEEYRTASLDKRIASIRKAAEAGYLTGLHFDPMIFHDGWEDGYRKLVRSVFDAVSAERIAWISIGSLRFNPEMKKKIENNYPESRITCAEMVIGDDAKIRYVKPLRAKMYRFLYRELKKYVSEKNLIYLCMERWDVWDKVFGSHPDSIEHLDFIFAKSLYERFGLGAGRPEKDQYLKNP
jgi:spore photoproduct lyase